MASATHQIFVGSSQEKEGCKWAEKEEAGFSYCFWGEGVLKEKEGIHRPIPTLPKFFLPR